MNDENNSGLNYKRSSPRRCSLGNVSFEWSKVTPKFFFQSSRVPPSQRLKSRRAALKERIEENRGGMVHRHRWRITQDCIYPGSISRSHQVYVEVKKFKVPLYQSRRRFRRPMFANLYSFELDVLGRTARDGFNKVAVQLNHVLPNKHNQVGHFGRNHRKEKFPLIDVMLLSCD